MKKQRYYYNTTNESGEILKEYTRKSKTQEGIIQNMFFNFNRPMGATEAHLLCTNLLNVNWPLTSVRRAITNLMTKGELIKTSKRGSGLYGRDEYLYVINKEPIQQKLF